MSFPDLSNIPPLSNNNGPPVGTEGTGPSRPKNVLTNPISTSVEDGDYTGHTQRHQGIGDQSQSTWEHVNRTGWDPKFYPEGETPCSPTELNSPTRYEVYTSPLQSQSTHRRSARARIPTRKAQEMEEMELSMGKVRGSSHKIQKKSAKRSKRPRKGDGITNVVPETGSSPAPPRNKFLNDGDLIFPTLQELCGMMESDREERAIMASG
ncbi:hypothetical protein ACJZ2D_013324 [Fusarium nematophilum]